MKVIVTTTYENLSKATVKYMIDKLEKEGWPKDQVNQIRESSIGIFSSKDPNSEETAVTSFLVDKYAP